MEGKLNEKMKVKQDSAYLDCEVGQPYRRSPSHISLIPNLAVRPYWVKTQVQSEFYGKNYQRIPSILPYIYTGMCSHFALHVITYAGHININIRKIMIKESKYMKRRKNKIRKKTNSSNLSRRRIVFLSFQFSDFLLVLRFYIPFKTFKLNSSNLSRRNQAENFVGL